MLPPRETALRGLEMVQYLNNEFMLPLQGAWPAELLGPMGDGPKINCTTCHQGLPFPLFGLASAAQWPTLFEPAGEVGPLLEGDTALVGAPDARVP